MAFRELSSAEGDALSGFDSLLKRSNSSSRLLDESEEDEALSLLKSFTDITQPGLAAFPN